MSLSLVSFVKRFSPLEYLLFRPAKIRNLLISVILSDARTRSFYNLHYITTLIFWRNKVLFFVAILLRHYTLHTRDISLISTYLRYTHTHTHTFLIVERSVSILTSTHSFLSALLFPTFFVTSDCISRTNCRKGFISIHTIQFNDLPLDFTTLLIMIYNYLRCPSADLRFFMLFFPVLFLFYNLPIFETSLMSAFSPTTRT